MTSSAWTDAGITVAYLLIPLQRMLAWVDGWSKLEMSLSEAVQRVLNQFDQLGREAHEKFNQNPDGPWDASPLIARDRAFLEAARIVTKELS